jgi:RHS repeat-associated protein
MATPYTYKLSHDQNGRIIEKTETVNGKPMNWTYSYDKKGRLHEARLDNRLICQCQYDRQGRRQQDYFPRTHGSQMRNYSYRMDNRLQQAGNNGYTHDEQGFRSIWNSSGKYTLYEYAPDYRLLKVEKPDNKVVFEFTHDDNGQREMKYRNGEMIEAYTWLDFIRLAGFHDGEIGYRFAYNGEERTPYAMQREDGVEAYLFYDQVGSLRVVADHSGNVIKEVLYDPFGGIIEDTNPELRIPIGFAGGLHDQDLGFVRFGWRDYDTFTSRWTAPDPLGDAGGDSDWYGYCLDDPVNGVDPTGLFAGVLAPFIKQAAEGTSDFVRNYCDMKEANTIGADKYFHCKANYEASKRGPGSKAAAWGLSELRELYGQMKGDPKSDKEADQKANRKGRNSSHLKSCGEACDEYRPRALDKRW